MSLRFIIFGVVVIGLIFFFIFARKKKWINSAGGIYTGQVLMHDLAMKDKQRAMEYVIENQERAIKKDDESGEDPKGVNFKHGTDQTD